MVRGNTTEEHFFHRNSLFNTRFRNFALTISVGVALLIFSRNIDGLLSFALAGLAMVFGVSSIIFASTLKWPEDGLTSSSKQQTLAWISLIVSLAFTIIALLVGISLTNTGKKFLEKLTPKKARAKVVVVTPRPNL